MTSKSQYEIPIIAPSMLKCDFGNLAQEIEDLKRAKATLLHLDVMDGHFVPNLSYGAMVIKGMRALNAQMIFDAHLMISDPEKYLDDYLDAGCDWITFHIEAVPKPVPLLKKIREAGKVAGIAINPNTPVSAISTAIGECDLVLIMSVEPGFGGQKFMPIAIDKVKQVRKQFGDDVLISIDGGIGPATIESASAAGAEVFVAGSSIFDQACYQSAISQMSQLAVSARA